MDCTPNKAIPLIIDFMGKFKVLFFTNSFSCSIRVPYGFMMIILGKNYAGKEDEFMKTIKIRGMSCNHCVMAVTKALGRIEGVTDIRVDLARGEAAFEETKPVDMMLVEEGIRKAGYELDG